MKSASAWVIISVYIHLGFSWNAEALKKINAARIGGNGTYVHFNPQICPAMCSHQKKDLDYALFNMLQLISTRFAGVALSSESINHDPDFLGLTHVAGLVNEANGYHHQSVLHLLDIMINIDVNPPKNISRELERTWSVAQLENDKVPGTVTMIAFDRFHSKDTLFSREWDKFKSALLNRFESSNRLLERKKKVQMKSDKSLIRWAVYVDVTDCNAFNDEFDSIKTMVNTVIVDISSAKKPLQEQEMASTLRTQLLEWKMCTENLTSRYPSIEVMISGSCSTLASNTIISSSMHDNVAECWETLDKWGKDKNVRVIFAYGFSKAHDAFGGWWTLKPDKIDNKIITAVSFEETFKSLVEGDVANAAADKLGEIGPFGGIGPFGEMWILPSAFIILSVLVLIVIYVIDHTTFIPRKKTRKEAVESSMLNNLGTDPKCY